MWNDNTSNIVLVVFIIVDEILGFISPPPQLLFTVIIGIILLF